MAMVFKYILLVLLVSLFCLNMGGGGFGASFAAAYGGGILSKRRAQLLFIIFVLIGAMSMGERVAITLGEKIVPSQLIGFDILLVIITSATACLFIANLIQVPQSTSLVTVGSILGVGLYLKEIYVKTFLYLVPFWIGLPLTGYFLTYILGRYIYPPRKSNFWIYEKLVNHKNRLKMFVITASCYNAFSVGTNNVANAAGPFIGANIVATSGLAFLLMAPLFGLGSLVFQQPLKTAGRRIIPLGLFSATLVCFVSGTLMIIASMFGVPQSFVMIKVASILAISGLKNGYKQTFSHPATKRIYFTWIITPIIAAVLSYFGTFFIMR